MRSALLENLFGGLAGVHSYPETLDPKIIICQGRVSSCTECACSGRMDMERYGRKGTSLSQLDQPDQLWGSVGNKSHSQRVITSKTGPIGITSIQMKKLRQQKIMNLLLKILNPRVHGL